MNDDIRKFLKPDPPAQPVRPAARKPAQRSAAEILAESKATSARVQKLLAETAPPTALATLDRLAADRAKQSGATREQAYSEVLAENPALYATYRQELAAGRYAQQATEPPAAPRPARPAADLLDQLARERAASEQLSYADALQAVAAERPSLYAAYRKEGLKR